MHNSIPLLNHCYRDAHGVLVTVESIEFNRVVFYREGYRYPSTQPIERFMKEFGEVVQ